MRNTNPVGPVAGGLIALYLIVKFVAMTFFFIYLGIAVIEVLDISAFWHINLIIFGAIFTGLSLLGASTDS